MRHISLFNTYIHPSAQRRVAAVLKSTFLSEGSLVKEFETRLANDLGWKNPVAVNSGTSSLHLALHVAGIGPGDEVILPAQTFVATGLAILHVGAKPVFADIQYDTGNIDPADIERRITKRTKAIMPVHWIGYPCDMREINKIAKRHNVLVIEDAAHAPGATYQGRPVGSLSDIACFSFQATKHITTGDGGAVAFRSKRLAEQGFIGRWFGIDRKRSKPSILGERIYDISKPGFKYHMNDLAAALGLANLENFPARLKRRRAMAKRYHEGLSDVPDIVRFRNETDREGSHWFYPIHVTRAREKFIRTLRAKSIPSTILHVGIDRNRVFGRPRDLVQQRASEKTLLHLPLHDGMTFPQIDYVIDGIKAGW